MLALLSTIVWILIVAVILGLFGTTSGGAWSIAGSVARGVRDWTSASQRVPLEASPRSAVSRLEPVEAADVVELGERSSPDR